MGARYLELYPPSPTRPAIPPSPPRGPHWRFEDQRPRFTRSAFVVTVPRGEVWGVDGGIVTSDGWELADLGRAIGARASGGPGLPVPPPTRPTIDGTLAVLSGRGAHRNYHHWLFDTVARYHLLRSAGVTADWVVVPPLERAFQRESLLELDLGNARVISAADEPYLAARELVVPSPIHTEYDCPPWVCAFLRATFLRAPRRKGAVRRRLLISRQRATTGRRVTNEPAVVDALRPWCVTPVVLEDLPFREQVRLFRDAELVIAPHGAGLANTVFCDPGSTVVEIFSPKCVRTTLCALATNAGLDYRYLLGVGAVPARGDDPDLFQEDIVVDTEELAAVLDTTAIARRPRP